VRAPDPQNSQRAGEPPVPDLRAISIPLASLAWQWAPSGLGEAAVEVVRQAAHGHRGDEG
jgi:hypothetical protein